MSSVDILYHGNILSQALEGALAPYLPLVYPLDLRRVYTI